MNDFKKKITIGLYNHERDRDLSIDPIPFMFSFINPKANVHSPLTFRVFFVKITLYIYYKFLMG